MIGHSYESMSDDLEALRRRLGATTGNDVMSLLGGGGFADAVQARAKAAPAMDGMRGKAMRFAAGPTARKVLRVLPGVAAGSLLLDAGNVIGGNESFGNKVMDTAGMAIGGGIGALAGPLGAISGASIGKSASDALQYLFGDKLTPEQRKLRETLLALQGGRF